MKAMYVRSGIYVDAVYRNTRYAKTKVNKTVNNFVHFSQFPPLISKSICC